jgi:hypothetical protein
MPTATIILSDDNGAVACKATFEGGWDSTSHAHQHAHLMLKHMDDLCTRVTTPEVQEVPDDDAAQSRMILLDGD